MTSHDMTSRNQSAPHHTSPHLTTSHITSSHLATSHRTSYRIAPHRIASRHVTSHHVTSRHITSHHIIHITSHHITSPPPTRHGNTTSHHQDQPPDGNLKARARKNVGSGSALTFHRQVLFLVQKCSKNVFSRNFGLRLARDWQQSIKKQDPTEFDQQNSTDVILCNSFILILPHVFETPGHPKPDKNARMGPISCISWQQGRLHQLHSQPCGGYPFVNVFFFKHDINEEIQTRTDDCR